MTEKPVEAQKTATIHELCHMRTFKSERPLKTKVPVMFSAAPQKGVLSEMHVSRPRREQIHSPQAFLRNAVQAATG